MRSFFLAMLIVSAAASAAARAPAGGADEDDADAPTTRSASALPIKTSRYNRGGFPGRYRDAAGKTRKFELKRDSPLYDGAGREIGRVAKPLMLNMGAAKSMDVDID